ncbi:hypothetical protein JCGZ_05416 [Jatropha curcas]|uniref:RING-type domain-containing protein n=1 Tax=Jatropha curcas TaxID=180498 RepID=A0A067LI90_JATCU|nr:uncharacterized protein LOC105627993 [Jatropha curcas]XP_020532556.1 uncharacterized protein LOC105627993 [Jatropha curcas]KDP43949.1 hypothetical protein JCGZ_05416 [Jatropha curcas]
MAIAGLHNVSVLDSSFLREPQSEAVSTRGDDGSTSTRASSLLQMWRELEDEHVVGHARGRIGRRLLQHRSDGLSSDLSRVELSDSHGSEHSCISEDVSVGENDFGQWSPGPIGSENGQEDSSDMGEIERERVRQIFREWMNCAARECGSNISRRNNSSRAEWLGETEQERVRVIRESVQMNSRQRGTCADRREEHGAEIAGQIEQVLDGSVVNLNEGRAEHTRRGIRRLCGRQALLDMLKKSEIERQRELQGLLEHRAVSQFAHRIRIQSLLRGRFLRNDRIIEDDRSMSTAASELGLLRLRHTVSDLREGFSSRLDHSICGQASSSTFDTASNTDINSNGSEQTQENNSQLVICEFHEQIESNVEESNNRGLLGCRNDIRSNIVEDRSPQEPTSGTEEAAGQAPETEIRERQQLVNFESVDSRYASGEDVSGNQREGNNESVAGEPIPLLPTNEVFSQQTDPDDSEISGPMLSNHLGDLEGNVEDVNQIESAAQVDQWQSQVLESEARGFFGDGFGSNEQSGGIQDNIDGPQHETIASEWLENDEREEETSEVWHEDGGFQEAVQSWLQEPSEQEAVPVARIDPFYYPEDDNVYSMELRELLSRRSVSTLLRSGFRESLDQLIQSYVERQSHVPLDWELQETDPTSASVDQDVEQQNRDQNEGLGEPVQSPPITLPSSSLPPVQQLWDQDTRNFTWPQHDVHQRFGIEWDIINDLRIDMARLQQRMNNMQRMLEACMDMQLELQRSIRQEVSAALNRAAGSSEMCDNGLPEDRAKWDHVRKGICSICCSSNIDSLLYRCGHMCTCSKCANELVQKGEKCPMCRAPVIEVIRAYSIL